MYLKHPKKTAAKETTVPCANPGVKLSDNFASLPCRQQTYLKDRILVLVLRQTRWSPEASLNTLAR